MRVVFNNDDRVTGFEAFFLMIVNSILIFPNICIDVLMSVVAGALAGWLLGLLPLGTWITDGLNLIPMAVRSEDLYKFGATLGFVRCFFRMSHSSGHTKVKP